MDNGVFMVFDCHAFVSELFQHIVAIGKESGEDIDEFLDKEVFENFMYLEHGDYDVQGWVNLACSLGFAGMKYVTYVHPGDGQLPF